MGVFTEFLFLCNNEIITFSKCSWHLVAADIEYVCVLYVVKCNFCVICGRMFAEISRKMYAEWSRPGTTDIIQPQ